MAAQRLAPDTTATARAQWNHRPPWSDLPRDIAFASLRFTPEPLLADPLARQITLPDALRSSAMKRRADFMAGRLCASSAMERLGQFEAQVGLQSGGAPHWPPGVCGSISHAGGKAIAVAARIGRIQSLGVDMERLLSPDQAEAIAPLALTPPERDRFAACPTDLAVTAIFSLKEALFKLLHPLTGVMFFHEQAEVLSLESNGRAQVRLLDRLCARWPAGTTLPALWHCSSDRVFSLLEC